MAGLLPGVNIIQSGLRPPHGWQVERSKWIKIRADAEQDIEEYFSGREDQRDPTTLQEAENTKNHANHMVRGCEILLQLDTEKSLGKERKDSLTTELEEIRQAIAKFKKKEVKKAETVSEKQVQKKG